MQQVAELRRQVVNNEKNEVQAFFEVGSEEEEMGRQSQLKNMFF